MWEVESRSVRGETILSVCVCVCLSLSVSLLVCRVVSLNLSLSLNRSTRVHEIQFRNDGEGASSVGVDVSREFDGFARRHVSVGRSDGENNRIWIGNVIEYHVANLFLL